MEIELTENEQTFILLLRSFGFLRYEGYEVDEFSLSGLCSYISFKKKWSRLRIYIEWAPMNSLRTVIRKKRLLFDKEFSLNKAFGIINKNYVSEYEHPPVYITMQEVINYHAKFIQQHLMPIIRGEMWIDDLGKNKRKKNPTTETENINLKFEQWRKGKNSSLYHP